MVMVFNYAFTSRKGHVCKYGAISESQSEARCDGSGVGNAREMKKKRAEHIWFDVL